MSMIDGNMRGLLRGLGGAYCFLCLVHKDAACGRIDGIDVEDFCVINRSQEDTESDFERLVDDTGNVKKRRNDYADRKGLTQKPVLQEEPLLSVSPLHSVMRTFD